MTTPKKPPASTPIANGDNEGYTETLRSPVSGGTLTSPFSKSRKNPVTGVVRPHKGVDIAVPIGTPVRSAASGTVVQAGVVNGYGNYVRIRHDDDTETAYAHLSQINVRTGQSVTGGEIIAKSGNTGRSTGPHLHYEVIQDGVQVNPNATTVGINSNNRQKDARHAAEQQEILNRGVVLNYDQDAVIQSLISGGHFKNNSAEEFDNLTYHWRLFMTTDQEIVTAETTTANSTLQGFYEKLASFSQVTIAESGVTTYSIDEVSMEAVVGTEFQTESTLFTSIEMKITEPNGVNFLDALRNAGLETGVHNYQKCFYYLELTFKGYDQNGDINLSPFADSPNGGKWIWTVAMNDIQVGLNAGGGTYTLTMTPLTDSLLTGSYNIVPASLHVNGATVGEFMDNMCTRLNNVWARIKGQPGIIVYRTQFHPVRDLMTAEQVRAMPVIPKDEDFNSERDIAFDADRTAHIAQGFTISRVLDSLMSSCETAQNLAKDAVADVNSPNDSAEQINAKGYRQSIIWRMEPELNLPDYDPLFNEYYHTITLHIYGFRHHTAVLSPQDTTSDASTQKAILADMAKRNFLPKKYEYLFTGVNSEVIDIDLNFNLKFQALLPRLVDASQEQVAPQAKVRPAANVAEIQQREASSPQRVSSDQASSFQVANDLFNALQIAEKEEPRDDEKVKLIRAKYEIAKAANDRQSAITQATRAALQAGRPRPAASTDYSRSYGEDLTVGGINYAQKTNISAQQRKEAFPITIQNYDPSDTSGLRGQYHAGKSLYGAVLNQVYGPLATQFFQIQMTIKGDPYWIGAGSFEQAIKRKSDLFDGTQPNFVEGANCFLFKMKYPLGQDDNGNVILNTNETVTGVYQINKITHKFIDGKFTQVLNAIRVPIIDLYTSLLSSLYPNNTDSPGGEP